MRRPILILLIVLFPAFAACSYSTAFVVINESEHPIEVRYRVKRDAGVLSSTDTPAKIGASEVANRYRAQWRSLSPAEYQTSKAERTITVIVTVMPHEALWVTSMFHYVGDEDPNDIASWPIDEISLAGTDGVMTFTGQKARKSFSYVSRVLYTLTYK